MKIEIKEVNFSNLMDENVKVEQLLQAGCCSTGGCEIMAPPRTKRDVEGNK